MRVAVSTAGAAGARPSFGRGHRLKAAADRQIRPAGRLPCLVAVPLVRRPDLRRASPGIARKRPLHDRELRRLADARFSRNSRVSADRAGNGGCMGASAPRAASGTAPHLGDLRDRFSTATLTCIGRAACTSALELAWRAVPSRLLDAPLPRGGCVRAVEWRRRRSILAARHETDAVVPACARPRGRAR